MIHDMLDLITINNKKKNASAAANSKVILQSTKSLWFRHGNL